MSADVAPRAVHAELARLAVPAIGQQLVAALLFVADRALIGRLGPVALASLHAGTTIAWTATSLLGAVAIGATAAVGRRSGARHMEGAAHAVKSALALAVGLALLLVVPALAAREALVAALAPPEGAALAVAYVEIVLAALPFAAASAAASACLQARGDARTPFAAGAAAAVVNVVVSAALVPAWGVRGAALGTAIALALQCAWVVAALRRELHAVSAARAPSSMARVTAAAFVERIAFHAGYLVYAAMIARLGSDAVAANQAVLAVEALGYPIAEGLAMAAAVLVARKLGAEQPDEAWRAARRAAAIGALGLGAFGALVALAPGATLSLFIREAGVVAEGRTSLYLAALAQPFMAFAIVSMAALRGAGRGMTALTITLLSAVGVRLGATWLFGFVLELGLRGAWLASGVDWLVQAALAALVIQRDRCQSSVAFVRSRNRASSRARCGCDGALDSAPCAGGRLSVRVGVARS